MSMPRIVLSLATSLELGPVAVAGIVSFVAVFGLFELISRH